MDFTKFIDMLERKALFFSSAEAFDDKFEGTLPPLHEYVTAALSRISGKPVPSSEEKNKRAEKIMNVRYFTLVSSWHMNDAESYAMWKIYLNSNEGVALQTSYEKLEKCMTNVGLKNYVSEVKYYDPHSDVIPLNKHHLSLLTYKDRAYAFEHEVRAIVDLYDILFQDKSYEDAKKQELLENFHEHNGLHMNMKLIDLVDNVIVSPFAEKWFKDLVKRILARYELSHLYRESSLDRPVNL